MVFIVFNSHPKQNHHKRWADCFVLASRSLARFDQHAFVSPLIEVVEYGKKGRGYRAVQDIPSKVLLLQERPLLVRDTDESRYRAIGQIMLANIAKDSETAYEYFRENSFRVGDDSAHVFRFKSLFNHSCAPNCVLENELVTTAKPVEVGEELCISYISGVLHSIRTCVMMLPNKFRAKHLEKIFGFVCACDRCQDDVMDPPELQDCVDLPPNLPKNALDCDVVLRERVESLMKENEAQNFALLPYLVVWTMDRKWILRCIHWFRICFPPNFPATQKLEDFASQIEKSK